VPRLLLGSAFVVATCGLIYELLAGTLASYLLGDSVTQFSIIIGIYLFAMGVGSWLTQYVRSDLLLTFANIELMVGVVGGVSTLVLFWLYDEIVDFHVALYALVLMIGVFVGAEIPLLVRILKESGELKDVIARVFAVDYVGALLASIIFPLLLVPHLGLVRTAFLFGAVNVLTGLILLWQLPRSTPTFVSRTLGVLALVALGIGFAIGENAQAQAESGQYPGQVIYAHSTPYQRVVLSSVNGEVQLFLNGNLQFSARDEYRYHEALVHPAMGLAGEMRHVLILGGGDGLAAREVLRYPGVETVQLVDLDPGMTKLFRETPWLARLNGGSLSAPRLRITSADAFDWVRHTTGPYDVVIIDFPDPSNYAVGKLYTTRFYAEVARVLAPHGVVVVQATSPFVARKSYWCVAATLEAAGFKTRPYHALVPSFGDWGFVLATRDEWAEARALPAGLRFLDRHTMAAMFEFPPDTRRTEVSPNRLNDQILVRLFNEEWSRYLGG
jgi:spermidine synthase